MRVFHSVLLTGSQDSVEMSATLLERVHVGCALLSSIQQAQGRIDATTLQVELEDVVLDLATALLGRSIVLGPVLPGSPTPNGVCVRGL